MVLSIKPGKFYASSKCLSDAFRAEILKLSEYVKGGLSKEKGRKNEMLIEFFKGNS